jgi:hypothetical protein
MSPFFVAFVVDARTREFVAFVVDSRTREFGEYATKISQIRIAVAKREKEAPVQSTAMT